MDRPSTKATTAPALQQVVRAFLTGLRWSLEEPDEKTLIATRVLGGNTLRWCFHFEDERSFSTTPPSPSDFPFQLAHKAQQNHFFDLIAAEEVFASRHWTDYIRPAVDRRFATNSNWKYGTLRAFLNRFATDISAAHENQVDQLLKKHFIQKPVTPSFVDSPDAVASVQKWITSGAAPRLMLIKGDAGGGKSVFALMLVSELQRNFRKDPVRYPAPFLIWFSNERPGILTDLITLGLNDLGLSDSLTPEAVRLLLKQGRLLLILDGFDEVSRASAEKARQNVEDLSEDINKNTRGRLVLTSRPSFIAQEDIFLDLKHGCEEELHEERELAPYTDEQMHSWVVQNAPREEVAWPPERHWQRVCAAFSSNPDLRELCRTPVFLRMLSEILVKDKSVRSLYDLMEKFCLEMWDRERGKRTLSLSDEQYCFAYEAISALAMAEARIDPRDVKAALELYLQEYAPELLAGMGSEASSLMADLAIGPLTYRAGVFTFSHEVLQAYFAARLLARSLSARRKIDELWNRRISDAEWRFLPTAVSEICGPTRDPQAVIGEAVRPSTSGLVVWNLVRALGCSPSDLPRNILAGRDLAAIVFEAADLRGMSFDDSVLYDVIFDRSDLRDSTFRNTKIKKVKFIECGHGAIFDRNPRLGEESEVQFIRSKRSAAELYVGDDIVRFLAELTGRELAPAQAPSNLAEQAMLIVFGSLFKKDRRRLDYPEPVKIENRLRAWLQGFRFPDQKAQELSRILEGMLVGLRREGWIERNPNRPRTLVPSGKGLAPMLEAMRRNRVEGCGAAIEGIISSAQARCDAIR